MPQHPHQPIGQGDNGQDQEHQRSDIRWLGVVACGPGSDDQRAGSVSQKGTDGEAEKHTPEQPRSAGGVFVRFQGKRPSAMLLPPRRPISHWCGAQRRGPAT